MIVSSGYRKYGFDAYGGKVLRKEDMGFWMHMPERTRPQGVCLELKEDVEEVEKGFFVTRKPAHIWLLQTPLRDIT